MTIQAPDTQAVGAALQRAQALDDALMAVLNAPVYRPYDNAKRINTSVAAASVALEHARAVRVLMADDLPTSALSLMRLQHEALTRAVWSLYAASDAELDKLTAPLSKEAESAANRLPMLAILAGNPATGKRIAPLQTQFADCLPSPLTTAART